MNESFSRWRDSSRAAAESPNYRPPWLLADHPATWRVLHEYPDLFRQFELADWQTLERRFWRRWRASPAATDELLVLLACRLVRERYGGVGW